MGIYYLVANHDKREYIHGHAMGTGAKDFEMPFRVGPALLLLLKGRWRGDRVAVWSDTGSEYEQVTSGSDLVESGDKFIDISDKALELFRTAYLKDADQRLIPTVDNGKIRVHDKGPWFRLYDPDEESETAVEGWMRGWLVMHDPEDAEREDRRDKARLVEWLRQQGNRYEGLSARETLAAVITDIEAGEHRKES